MSLAYKVLKLNATNKTATVLHIFMLLLQVFDHPIHVIINRQIACSREMDQLAEFHIVLTLI